MNSIVDQLALWVAENSEMLGRQGIKLNVSATPPGTNVKWKSGVDMEYDGILVSFTVWEKVTYIMDLIVLDAAAKETVVMDEQYPSDPASVGDYLNEVVRKLVSGEYKGLARKAS